MNDNACLFVWRMVYSDSDCDFCHCVRERSFDEALRGLTDIVLLPYILSRTNDDMKRPASNKAGLFV